MRYQLVEWNHGEPGHPVRLFAEVDDEGWERRKVDGYRDGSLVRADRETDRRASTALSIEPLSDSRRNQR